MQDRNFELSLQEIRPVSMKPGGSRFGYVGEDKQHQPYLVKVEVEGYAVTLIGKMGEVAGVESFTAQLIRDIWGDTFATDIKFAPIDPQQSTFKVDRDRQAEFKAKYKLNPLEVDTVTIPPGNAWTVVVPFEETNKFFETQFYKYNKRLNQLQTIAHLIGMSDYKFENIILDLNDNLKLIDCGSNFLKHAILNDNRIDAKFITQFFFKEIYQTIHKTVELSSIDEDAVKQTLTMFANYSPQQLSDLLVKYDKILSYETQQHIFELVTTMQNMTKMFLTIDQLVLPQTEKQELMENYVEIYNNSYALLVQMEMDEQNGKSVDEDLKQLSLEVLQATNYPSAANAWEELSRRISLKNDEFNSYLHELRQALPESWKRFVKKFPSTVSDTEEDKEIKIEMSQAIDNLKNNLTLMSMSQAIETLKEILNQTAEKLIAQEKEIRQDSQFKENTLFKAQPFKHPVAQKMKNFIEKNLSAEQTAVFNQNLNIG